MVTLAAAPTSVLTEDLLERCGERAAAYDRENRFFTEDFEELRQAGYLLSAVPEQFGGRGLSLAEVCQRAAPPGLPRSRPPRWPPTCTCTGRALPPTSTARATLAQWLLEEAAAGEVFAAGHGESRQRSPVLLLDARGPSASRAATASPAARCSAA